VANVTTLHEYAEADWIAREIGRMVGGLDLQDAGNYSRTEDAHTRFSEIAVLYRIGRMRRLLTDRLRRAGIPYQVVGGGSLYEEPQVAAVIAALGVLSAAWQGNAAMQQRYAAALWALPTLQHSRAQKESVVTHLFISGKGLTINNMADVLIEQWGWQEHEAEGKWQELSSVLVGFEQLQDFLAYVDYLKQREYYDSAADRVTLLTMHAAKGLEFSAVFLPGFEDGLVPYTAYGESEEQLAEEKRLLYVALTRAKERVYLLRAQRRFRQPTRPSRFASALDIPEVTQLEDETTLKRQAAFRRRQETRSQLRLV
jgi:superfamily I DNA/RNA helicase